MADSIRVDVAYALPDEQTIRNVSLPAGSTLADAVRASGVLDQHPQIDLGKAKVGIFGKLAKLDTVLRDGDRVEIYRPLIADPKEIRRKRAEAGRMMKTDGRSGG